jgi:hypothetical protein
MHVVVGGLFVFQLLAIWSDDVKLHLDIAACIFP